MPEPTIAERDRELSISEYRGWLESCGYSSSMGLDEEDDGLIVRWQKTLATAREETRREALLEAEAICDAHAAKHEDIHSRVCAREIARLLGPPEEGSAK